VSSRRASLSVLRSVRDGEPFQAALDRAVAALTGPDRRLAHELAAGVLRRRSALDGQLAPLIPRGWGCVPADLRDVLRLGAFQLTTLDRVPAHAAVSTCVALAMEVGGAKAGGFVNAVLRRLIRMPPPVDLAKPTAERLAQAYSHPLWLVTRWLERYGAADTERLLGWNNTRPRLVVQPARGGFDDLAARWREAGIDAEPAPFGAGLVTTGRRAADLPGYAEGSFIVQDPAQALLARFASLPEDAAVYDACAAPGGKAITLGRAASVVVAADANRGRIRRLTDNLRRAGSGREYPVVADALAAPIRTIGVVLLDAPCLGTGTFARHPDARWRVTPEALIRLAGRQAGLLARVAPIVAPGGLLLYATCSLEPEENERQVAWFLERYPQFQRERGASFPAALTSPVGDLSILPHRHAMDGAYAARLRRVG